MNKDYRSIDATLSGLNKSSDAYFKWLVNVFYIVANKDAVSPEITQQNAHECCGFGIWLNKELSEERDDKSYLIEINDGHKAIHQKSHQLINALHCGDHSATYFDEFAVVLLDFNRSLATYKAHLLQRRTSYDALTGLPLRRMLDESFENTVAKFNRSGLYLLLLDIDHFKKINDNYGHLIGDDVLRDFSRQLDAGTRMSEPVYRYGGEEFIILLHAANSQDASQMAERIRASVAKTEINAAEHVIKITFSAGLTRVHENETLHDVLERADTALYYGKHTGRNRCIYIDRCLNMHHIIEATSLA